MKVDREPNNVYMIEEEIEDDITCFIDTDVNVFRAEVLVLKKDKHKQKIEIEIDTKTYKGDLWTFFFDGTFCKEGSGAGLLLISLVGITYKFSFTLGSPCTNNIAKHQALFLGLRLDYKNGLKCLQVIGDSELVVSQF